MLASLDEPLYILKDYVASEPTILRAKHNSKGGFTFSKIPENGPPEILFEVDSRSSLKAPRRVINNASGRAILELWRNHVGNDSYVGIPNIAALPLATVAPRPTKAKDVVDVYAVAVAHGLQPGHIAGNQASVDHRAIAVRAVAGAIAADHGAFVVEQRTFIGGHAVAATADQAIVVHGDAGRRGH